MLKKFKLKKKSAFFKFINVWKREEKREKGGSGEFWDQSAAPHLIIYNMNK